ncbi:MAG: DUF1800 domain-containing protein [Chloroflexi bacterium]|nr:DUF1800 domain-containing protein [Chloroflexota bacterium]MDL1942262.1 DUF1800 family protein [Chloroflexi bacterium CFX2]
MQTRKLTRRDFLKLGGVLATSSVLAACAPGEENPIAVPSEAADQDPVVLPEAQTPLPPVPLAVLALNRLTFGIRPGDIEAFHALGSTDDERLQNFLAQQLNPDSIDDSEFENRYNNAGFETLHKSLEQLYYDHVASNPYDANDDTYWEWYSQPAHELTDATVLRAAYSKRQLAEVLADFWHNHFNVFLWQDDGVPLIVSYNRDVLRRHMLGNFRQMLEAVAKHPSMLYYLNQNNSSDAGPNENFARELFELHTLGAENYLGVRDPNSVGKDADGIAAGYVDNDVYEAARCLTGWRVDDDLGDWEDGVEKTGNFLYYKPWHDRFNKLVLGKYIPADQEDLKDGHDVLDLLANHPGTARHIARKLCRRFISDAPPESIVQAAANTFLENRGAPDQLRRVMETILLSAEFKAGWGGKVKRPFEAAMSMLRALNSDFIRIPGGVHWMLGLMGQALFERRPPDGYPDVREAWANSMSLLYRWNFAVGLAENWMDDEDTGYRIFTDVYNQTPAEIRTASSLADYWIQRILNQTLPDASRRAVIAVMAQEYGSEEPLPEDHVQYVLPAMVEAILMSPEFQWR